MNQTVAFASESGERREGVGGEKGEERESLERERVRTMITNLIL